MSQTYDRSMRRHQDSAQRHEAAAALWDERHEPERAEFERRCAQIEREAAQLDADRLKLERLRASWLAQPDEAGRARIDRLSREIERRSAQLQADDEALEQERVRLWPRDERWGHERSARIDTAPVRREIGASERKATSSHTVDDALGAARRVAAQTRENAMRLSSVLSQTADVIETSATLAEANAERLERAGRIDAGAEERRAAERARVAEQRARLRAKEWLEFALSRSRY
jgi:hypothetical protein